MARKSGTLTAGKNLTGIGLAARVSASIHKSK